MVRKLNTTMLFQLFLERLKPDLLCDVGTMDGSHARMFRRHLPDAHIIAFEANPNNFRALRENPDIAADRIEVQHKAVHKEDGMLSFFVESYPDEKEEAWRQGSSSLRKRADDSLGAVETSIEAVRLDTFIEALEGRPERIALWVDVEGAAFEVLEGLEKIRDRVVLVHVEVETREVWAGQKLKPEVRSLMEGMGFELVARGYDELQHDLVYVRRKAFQDGFFGPRPYVFCGAVLTRLRESGLLDILKKTGIHGFVKWVGRKVIARR